ncbi:hypothetical protein ACU686_34620 [Yinghuangia aomiensis]
MRIIVFGATGMVGRGVLDACLRDDAVTGVLVVGRTPTGRTDPKLREVRHEDFADFTAVEEQFAGYDGCFYCLGASALGMGEAGYRVVSYDFPWPLPVRCWPRVRMPLSAMCRAPVLIPPARAA